MTSTPTEGIAIPTAMRDGANRRNGGLRRWLGCGALAIALGLMILPANAAILAPTLLEISGGEEVSAWIAMAHSVRARNLDLVGIVVVGDCSDAASFHLAADLRKLLNRPDIPVIPVVQESAPKCPFALLDGSGKGITSLNLKDPGAQILGIINKYSGNLQVLSTGSVEGLLAAKELDPSSTSHLRRILLSRVTLEADTLGGDGEFAGPMGDLLLDATCPIVLFPQSGVESVRFSQENLVALAHARTPLSDALTGLIADAARSLGDPETVWKQGVPLPQIAMVAYAAHPNAVQLEKRKISLESAAGRQVDALVAVSCQPEPIVGNLVAELNNPMIDFGLGFSHYLFNLGRLSQTSKGMVSEKLKNVPAPDAIQDASAVAQERLRRVLDYLESSMNCFQGIENDPSVDAVRQTLLETYRNVASIGWLFPDSFYPIWQIPVTKKGEFQIDLGISNPHGRRIENLQVRIGIEDRILAEAQREVATGEVSFHFISSLAQGQENYQFDPTSGPLRATCTYSCVGQVHAATLPLEIAPDAF